MPSRAEAVLLLVAGCLASGCERVERQADEPSAELEGRGSSRPVPDRAAPVCLADTLGALRLEHVPRPGCTAADLACRDACFKGDASSCYERAIQIEHGDSSAKSQAVFLFHRACKLGHASGCTNYAAHIWGDSGRAAELPCAQRIFEETCRAKDTFGCGMLGRMLVDSGRPDDVTRGESVLENSCDELRGFVCRALALELESGKLGEYGAARIEFLLDRACAGGDPDACGKPASASETFH